MSSSPDRRRTRVPREHHASKSERSSRRRVSRSRSRSRSSKRRVSRSRSRSKSPVRSLSKNISSADLPCGQKLRSHRPPSNTFSSRLPSRASSISAPISALPFLNQTSSRRASNTAFNAFAPFLAQMHAAAPFMNPYINLFSSPAFSQRGIAPMDRGPARQFRAKPRPIPAHRKHGVEDRRRLFVSKMHPSVSVEELKERFSEYGKVTEAFIVTERSATGEVDENTSLGKGFVQFEKAEDAEMAKKELDGCSWDNSGDKISVEFSAPKVCKEGTIVANRLHLRNLAYTLTGEEIRTAFEPFGKLIDCWVVKDKLSPGQNTGVGFVEFEVDEHAEKARIALDKSTELNCGRPLHIEHAVLQGQQLLTRLQVKNVHRDISLSELKEEFSAFGKVVKVWNDELTAACCYVEFKDESAAKTAKAAMDKAELRNRPIYVRYAVVK